MFGRRAVIPLDVETEKKKGNEILDEYLANTSVLTDTIKKGENN